MQRVTKLAQLFVTHLLNLMGGVAAFNLVAECPSLHRLAQNCSWSTCSKVFTCSLKRCIQLAIVVPAAGQRKNVVIAEMRDHFAKSRVWAKEVFANVISILDDVSLEFSVNSRVHFVEQRTRRVFRQ